jgi:hypothetical protein
VSQNRLKFESENETLKREESERIGTYVFAEKLAIVFENVFAILTFKIHCEKCTAVVSIATSPHRRKPVQEWSRKWFVKETKSVI